MRHKIPIKKKAFGQHFLRKQSVVDNMISQVSITPETTILEIGCGDGFLTKSILCQTKCKKLICYEIDPEWISVVRDNIDDERLEIIEKNILDVTQEELCTNKPMVVLANLPYQITFPIIFLLQKSRNLIQEGVVMVQEEVAQKIVATRGRPYSATSIFLQHYFHFSLMEKIEPQAFSPPPKIFSRLLYFKPKNEIIVISNEEGFWKFVKLCFKSPRRTLHNNLKMTHYDLEKLPAKVLRMRAAELSFSELLEIWNRTYIYTSIKHQTNSF
jgi:16S rRNA (adenine1518-N6/adenine1519-N6)-dimethyltransferase